MHASIDEMMSTNQYREKVDAKRRSKKEGRKTGTTQRLDGDAS